jgi:site-specific recombinase XerD
MTETVAPPVRAPTGPSQAEWWFRMALSSLPQYPVPIASVDNGELVAQTIDRAKEYAEAAHAKNTRRGYASDWRSFTAWCATRAVPSLPATAQTVALYVTDLAQTSKLATIRRHVAAIAFQHRENGLESPTAHDIVRRIVRGIARTIGAAQTRKSAATLSDLKAMMLEVRGDGLKAFRDRACVLLGFAGALRRSELAALEVDDVIFCKEGVRLRIRRSKTDQDGRGTEIAIPYVAQQSLCAARAARAWIDAAGLTAGPLFRTFTLRSAMTDRAIDGRDVANLIKTLARRARLEGDFSGHSLRAGFVTTAAQAKVSLDSIARTTRHKSLAVLMTYVRPAQAFDDVALSAMIA